jgi:hypothetical protein
MKPAFYSSHTPWKFLWDSRIPMASTTTIIYFEDRQSPPQTRNPSHSHRKGLVNHVPCSKR